MEQTADLWKQALLPQFLDLTASRQIQLDIERGTLESGGDPLPSVIEIGKTAHKIAGTAESFGFAALGKQAQAVERLCTALSAAAPPQLAKGVTDHLLPALISLSAELDLALNTAD
jgi:HPt (histidine-containing phosphotransfer) domain-containing protein